MTTPSIIGSKRQAKRSCSGAWKAAIQPCHVGGKDAKLMGGPPAQDEAVCNNNFSLAEGPLHWQGCHRIGSAKIATPKSGGTA